MTDRNNVEPCPLDRTGIDDIDRREEITCTHLGGEEHIERTVAFGRQCRMHDELDGMTVAHAPKLFFELGVAMGMGKRVVPIVPRETDTSKLPFDLRSRHYLLKDSPEDTAEELAHALIAA